MKVLKIFYSILIFLLTVSSCFAIEEPIELITKEKTLKEKLNDIYHLEVEQTEKPFFLLTEVLTKNFEEDSLINKLHLWGGYVAHSDFIFSEDNYENTEYLFDAINVGLDGKVKNNNADFRLMLHYSPTSTRDFENNLFADAYIATNKIPHHRIWLGNTRPRLGMEGGYSPYALPYIARSQISRNFGTVRRLGARVSGDYSLVDYDLGIYSSDTYFQSFFPGTEFIGWLNLKPLGKTDGKYGKITLGSGLQTGHRDNSYTVVGSYAGYEYKKWLMNFEWANADGYNGPSGHSTNKKATGFYTTLGYKFTPKVQGLLRYDQFDPNKNIANNNIKEYSAGINYFIKGQALKLVLNYVFCQRATAKDSHKIILETQILL